MRFLLAIFFLSPLSLTAQGYSDSIFSAGELPGAAPLSFGKKFSIYAMRAVGPRALGASLLVSGLNEWKDDPGKWGRGWDGYGKRYASTEGRGIVREVAAWSAGSVLRTDPRIYRSASTKFMPRLRDALVQVVVTRSNSGKRVPAFANVGSAFAAGQVSTLWLPRNDAHFSDGLVSSGVILLSDAGRNVFREFWPDIRRKIRH